VLSFLQHSDFDARERLTPLTKIESARGDSEEPVARAVPARASRRATEQLLILPGARLGQEEWDAIHLWVRRGGNLFVAGVTRPLPAWTGAELAAGGGAVSALVTVASDATDRLAPFAAALPPGPTIQVAPASQSDGDGDNVTGRPLLMRAQEIYAVERPVGQGRSVVLADDRLFTNASLLVADNASLMLELLGEDGRQIELADRLTGLASSTPLASVHRGRLAPVLLQLALLAVIFFACQGAAFGRPADPAMARRRAFSEHVRALGWQYARRGASRHALELYATYALERFRERLRFREGKGLHRLAEAIAARGTARMEDVLKLLVEARPAPAGDRPTEPSPEDLASLRGIATLMTETGGSGERSRAG